MATKRKLQAQETKKRLLNTATRLISERGFESVSIQDITSECDVAPGTFYLYFKSKEELLIYLSNQIHEQIQTILSGREGKSPLETLRELLLCWKQWFDHQDPKQASRIYLVYSTMNVSGTDHPVRNEATFERNVFSELLTEAVVNKELTQDTPIAFFASMLSMIIHGMNAFYSYSCSQEERDAWWEQYLCYIFDEMLLPYKTTK